MNDPEALERLLPGLTSLSSAYGAVRADDGLCCRHDLLVAGSYWCAAFLAQGESPSPRELDRRPAGPQRE
jgi:hypothetical protein